MISIDCGSFYMCMFHQNLCQNPIYLFIYLLNFAIHTDINKWQGHHNSVHQLLWALLKLSNTVNLRIQLNLSQYNITRYNTIRYNTCTIQYITTEYNIIARTRFNFHRHHLNLICCYVSKIYTSIPINFAQCCSLSAYNMLLVRSQGYLQINI